MRRVLTIALLACLAPLATARAEEPSAPTYPLDTWRETWKVGDVVTIREESTFSMSFQIEATNPQTGEAQTQEQENAKLETLIVVEKVLDADAKGNRTKFLVHMTEWKQVMDDAEPDESLKGSHLEVTVADGAHTWKMLTPGAKPSESANEWLDHHYGKDKKGENSLDLDRMGRPAGPVKVGDAWKGDPLALDCPFPLKKDASSVDLKLLSVDEGAFRVGVKVKLQLDGFPLGNTGLTLPFTEGGVLEGEGDMRHTLAAHTHGGGAALKVKLQGVASKKGLATVRLGMEMVADATKTAGGEMPPVPAPKPAEPADAPK